MSTHRVVCTRPHFTNSHSIPFDDADCCIRCIRHMAYFVNPNQFCCEPKRSSLPRYNVVAELLLIRRSLLHEEVSLLLPRQALSRRMLPCELG